jgi:hypothetical protein
MDQKILNSAATTLKLIPLGVSVLNWNSFRFEQDLETRLFDHLPSNHLKIYCSQYVGSFRLIASPSSSSIGLAGHDFDEHTLDMPGVGATTGGYKPYLRFQV